MKLDTIVEFLKGYNTYSDDSVLLLASLVKIAHIGGINNITAKSPHIHTRDNTTVANIYAVTFLDSSGGKDKPLREIEDNLCADIAVDFEDRSKESYGYRREKLVSEAKSLFPDDEKEQKRYILTNRPRKLTSELSDATLEGFVSLRQEYSKAEFGGTFVRISEFGDYITSDNTARSEFLSMLTEVYDHGNNNVKVTKGERENMSISRVPSSAIMHTSPAGLLEGKNREKLFTFFNRGIARRALICYPERDISAIKSLDEMIRIKKAGDLMSESIEASARSYFEDFYNKTKPEDNCLYNTNNTFEFTTEANDILEKNEMENARSSLLIEESTDTAGIKSEMTGRSWKALKLSALIAAFEHPEHKKVEKEDILSAIKICNGYAKHLKRFYVARPTGDSTKLYQYFIKNINIWIPKLTIYKEGFVRQSDTNRWLDETLPIAIEMLEDSGYSLLSEKHGSRGMKYKVTKMVAETKASITISQGASNNKTETSFMPAEIPFTSLHTVIRQDRAWCATTFSNNYRRDDNATGRIDVVAFDIDSGLTVKDCLDKMRERGVRALIITTKSHRVAKDKQIACDRYRVVIPLSQTATLSKEEYKNKVRAIAKAFDLPSDPAAVNISRLWFGNPSAKYKYTEGGAIDINAFDLDDPVLKKQYASYTESGGSSGGMKRWFVQNGDRYGGRNNALYVAKQFFLNDKGLPPDEVRELVLDINRHIGAPLEEDELNRTVFKNMVSRQPLTLAKEVVAMPEVTPDNLPF